MEGTFYLHVLTIDNAGNTTQTKSEPITVFKLISFSVDSSATFYVRDGWNWLEFVQSKYNTAGYTCSGLSGQVISSSTTHIINPDNYADVFGNSIIISGKNYRKYLNGAATP